MNQSAELPLFPLDVVLFPTMPLPLHIFEERYVEMVDRCVRESRPFGIVLAAEDLADGVQTGDVGCTARIARVEHLPNGQMNIEVVGEQRFRVLDTHTPLPRQNEPLSCAMGRTEPVEDAPADAGTVAPLVAEVSRLLRELVNRTLAQAGEDAIDFSLPEDPAELSFLAAQALPVENDEKQTLLSERDTAERLSAERDLLRREVTRLRRAEESVAAESGEIVWEPVEVFRYADIICRN